MQHIQCSSAYLEKLTKKSFWNSSKSLHIVRNSLRCVGRLHSHEAEFTACLTHCWVKSSHAKLEPFLYSHIWQNKKPVHMLVRWRNNPRNQTGFSLYQKIRCISWISNWSWIFSFKRTICYNVSCEVVRLHSGVSGRGTGSTDIVVRGCERASCCAALRPAAPKIRRSISVHGSDAVQRRSE